MKIGIYARVSDIKLKEDGERRQDVNRQVEKIKAWMETGEWLKEDTLEVYIDDGKSAFQDDYSSRPAFCKLLRDIKSRQIKRVFIEDLTRWSRRVEDGLRTIRIATENNCTVTSLAEGEIDTTLPERWLRCAMGLMMAEWASRSQGWKVKSGMAKAKAAGKHTGRPKKGRSGKGEVNPAQAENPGSILPSE